MRDCGAVECYREGAVPIIFPHNNSCRMLLNTGKRQPSASFAQELEYLRTRTPSSQGSYKNAEYFRSMSSVLDLLRAAHPGLGELGVLKQALGKWYEHLQEEAVARGRQLLEMRDTLTLYVTREIGITLEEIAAYLRQFLDDYCDDHMRRLYAQYLQAVKKLEWQQNPPPPSTRHRAVQTQEEELLSSPPTAKSLRSCNPLHPSEGTIDSPLRSHQPVDLRKYIQTKEENLNLERKIDQMASRIGDLEAENRNLKRELSHLHDENLECRTSREKELQEVARLKQVLSDLKTEEEAHREREQARRSSLSNVDRRYEDCDSIKNALHQSLHSAELELLSRELPAEEAEESEWLIKNYQTVKEDRYQTVKKSGRGAEAEDGSELRMLLLQALTIESYLMNLADCE